MRRAVLADTGPLYAAADPDDAHDARAQRELKRLARDKHVVFPAYPTLAEVCTLVLRRLANQVAAGWLNDVVAGTALLDPTPEDYHAAMTKVLAFPDQPITLFDATLAVMGQRLGVEIWTYDHHFGVMRAALT
jgi:predicted nucleic acid-binding protein